MALIHDRQLETVAVGHNQDWDQQGDDTFVLWLTHNLSSTGEFPQLPLSNAPESTRPGTPVTNMSCSTASEAVGTNVTNCATTAVNEHSLGPPPGESRHDILASLKHLVQENAAGRMPDLEVVTTSLLVALEPDVVSIIDRRTYEHLKALPDLLVKQAYIIRSFNLYIPLDCCPTMSPDTLTFNPGHPLSAHRETLSQLIGAVERENNALVTYMIRFIEAYVRDRPDPLATRAAFAKLARELVIVEKASEVLAMYDEWAKKWEFRTLESVTALVTLLGGFTHLFRAVPD